MSADSRVPASDAPAPPREPTFAEVLAKRPPEERAGIRAVLAYQQRRLPEDVVRSDLIRAMAKLCASGLECPDCGCRCFIGHYETAHDDGPVCPVCQPAAAAAYLNERYPETRP